ncbi:MAG: SurA N-terminal domain-containing protein [Cocleimonas sp.]
MLQTINDKAKGWVAYTVVGLIAVPFALFGISSYLDGGSGGLVAAKVNGEEIPAQQVQGIVLQQRQRLAQMFGGRLPPNMSENAIKNQALEQVVNEVLIRQESEKNGYRASNQEVYDTISGIEAFQTNGQFNSQAYEELLASQRRSKSEFENQIRDSISNQQFTEAVTNGAFIPSSLVSKYQGLQNQTRDVETFTLNKADYESQVSVSADEVKTEFDANLKSYMTTEKVKLSYVLLKQDDIAANLSPEDGALQLFYEDNQSRYIEPEQRRVAHILVKITDDKKEEAQVKAQGFYDQIQAGEKTFEELAVSASDDELAVKKNGEIGLIAQGEMGVQFDTAVFSVALLKGSMSEVVETEAGFAILKILDVIASKTKSFDSVKSEVEKLYRTEESEKLFLDQTDKLQTLAFENDSSLDEAADSVGMKVLTSGWIEKNSIVPASDDKPLSSPKVTAAAFSDAVLTEGKNSELIELDAKNVVVVRLQEHELPKQKELTSVENDIKKSLTFIKLKTLLVEKGDAALKVLSESGSWSALENIGATTDKIQKKVGFKRTDTTLARNIVSKIFSMKKPETGNSFDKVILPDGDYVLISLSKVTDDTAEVDSALQQSYTQSIALRERAAAIAALREKADVELFSENLQ